MRPAQFAAVIDHTLLKPEATAAQVDQLAAEAVANGFASACVNGAWTQRVADALGAESGGDRPACCACVGFPFGAAGRENKAAEAAWCVLHGAGEIDMVAFLPLLLQKNVPQARDDIRAVVEAARGENEAVVVKVILETALLDEAQIAAACEAAALAGADFVKTSTGFHPAGGATLQAVRWLKKYAGPMRVKAAGGIRDLRTAQAMLDAGADRLGCSAGVELLKAWPAPP